MINFSAAGYVSAPALVSLTVYSPNTITFWLDGNVCGALLD